MASSGLGHVARGIETWALDTFVALSERGADASLFSGAPLMGVPFVAVPNLRRSWRRSCIASRMMPGPLWRCGLKSAYGWEQFTFWLALWPKLRKGRYDILHVQDAMVAYWCRKFRGWGLVKTKEILAHGTEEPLEFLEQFECVQHLAPWHLEQAEESLSQRPQRAQRVEDNDEGRTTNNELGAKRRWTAIPNFVDTDEFRPAGTGGEGINRRLVQPEAVWTQTCAAGGGMNADGRGSRRRGSYCVVIMRH